MAIFPAWALQHKAPGTELRLIKGNVYLYACSSHWDKDKKKTYKKSGFIIGRITPDGKLHPSKRREKLPAKDPDIDLMESKIVIKEFGLTHFFLHHLKDLIEQLKICFPQLWPYLLGAAYCRLYRHAPINQMAFILQHAYLSEMLENVSFTEKNIAQALRQAGRDREQARRFMQWDVPEGEYIMMDLTHLPSRSQNGAFAQAGYNNQKNFKGQINAMYIFGYQSLRPIFYRIIPGNIREINAFTLTLEESSLKHCTLIIDKGFYSKKNIEFLIKHHFQFVCPLKRNTPFITAQDRQTLHTKIGSTFFEYMGRIIWYTKITSSFTASDIVLYLDDALRVEEEKDYLIRIATHPKKYKITQFEEKKYSFGTLALLSNISVNTPEEIYRIYKCRNQIEVMYDGLKGVVEADKTYMQNEETLQGWMLANHIALIAHQQLYHLLHKADKLKKFSISSLVERLALVRKAKHHSKWVDVETVASTIKLLNQVGIPVT